MKKLIILLLFSSVAFAQGIGGHAGFGGKSGLGGTFTAGAAAIVLDVHNSAGSGASSVSSQAVTLTGVTAGDLITCQVLGDGVSGAYVSDSLNSGAYSLVVYDAGTFSGSPGNTIGIWYMPNSSSGNPVITAKYSATSPFQGISCQAWKNARTTLVLDPASAGITQFKDASTGANPTAGTAASPTNANELVEGFLTTGANTPTAGASFTLIDGISANLQFPEYWIQTTSTSTNCPYTMASDGWSMECTAFLPSTASAGVTPLNGPVVDYGSPTTGTAVTTTLLGTGTHGTPGGVWSGTLGAVTFVTSSPISFHTSAFSNGASFAGSTGTAISRTVTTGTGNTNVWTYAFPNTNATGTTGSSSSSFGFFFESTQSTLTTGDTCDFAELSSFGGDTLVLTLQGTSGAPQIVIERNPGTVLSSPIPITFGAYYWVTTQYNSGGTHKLAVYETSTWTQVGSVIDTSSSAGTVTSMSFGNEGSCTAKTGVNLYGPVKVDMTGQQFPLLP